jgi:hypothetical protein
MASLAFYEVQGRCNNPLTVRVWDWDLPHVEQS